MSTLLIILHVIVAFALILIVLLQAGKGASMGAAFGGGSSGTVFGSRGAGSFLGKMTAAAAIVFMLTSLALSIFVSQRVGGGSIMDSHSPITQESTMPAKAPESTAPVQTKTEQVPEQPKEQAKPMAPASGENK
ncbi:MAG: preprotein translocase subunit SecG [Deltaproteobacteria bacterium]|nr:preprotein translocase subunit SecG [Deltaproteobacteria bacterium]